MNLTPVHADWASRVEIALLTLAAVIFASGTALVLVALMDGL